LFSTPRDVEIAIFGAYGWIASERLYGRQFVSALMLRSDMVDIGDRGTPAERQQVNDFNMDDNNGMVRIFWPYWYQVIGAANAAMSGAEGMQAAAVDRGTPAERQQVNDFNMDDNNGMVRIFWPYWYQVIGAANAAISGAEGMQTAAAELNPLIAEA